MESSLDHPLYLHPIEQSGTYIYNSKDELITRSGAPLLNDGNLLANDNDAKTRGSKYNGTDWSTSFGVSAVLTNNNTYSSYFQNQKATPDGGSWVTSEAKYWPTDGSLSFYAYAPYCDDSHQMLSEKAAVDVANAKTVHYVASQTDVEHQPDLIVANHPNVTHGSKDAPTSVGLTFSHVLTAITFTVGSDMVPGTVKSIAIKGVKNTGDYNLETGTWTTSGADADFTISLGGGQGTKVDGTQDVALTSGNQTLMMIPQTFDQTSNAKVEIVFTKTGGQEQTLSASLANTSWTEGSTIIYKVSTSSLLPTLTLNNITFPTDWSSHTEYGGKLKPAYQDNDQLGLYVVAADGRVKAANMQVTRQGGNWTFPAGQPHINTNDKVFAYYPYQQSPQGNLPSKDQMVNVTTLVDANAFFKSLEDAWTPQTDQSTTEKMNASDLQVANAILSNTGSGIDLTMAHAMGLADITIGTGQVHFKLSNDANYTWDNPHLASEQFADKKPCKVADAHYVAVVKPNVATKFNSANGVDYAWKSELSFNPAADQIAKGTAIPVDKKGINPYTLKLGDIYYSDGSLTHPSDGLTKGKTPIGIVGYIASGKDDDDYWVEKNTKQAGIGGHALVMCLKMLGSTGPTDLGKTYALRVNGDDWSNEIPYIADYDNGAVHIKSSKNQKNGSGYLSTKCMVAHQSPAGIAALAYKDLPAPEKSTGWFVPSIGQYFALLEQMSGAPFQLNGWNRGAVPDSRKIRDTIEKAIEFAGDNKNYTQFFQVGQETHTSTAMTNRDNWFVTNYDYPPYGPINLFDGISADYESYEAHPVRPFLAF